MLPCVIFKGLVGVAVSRSVVLLVLGASRRHHRHIIMISQYHHSSVEVLVFGASRKCYHRSGTFRRRQMNGVFERGDIYIYIYIYYFKEHAFYNHPSYLYDILYI
jgi:hypothetical protein